MSLVFRPRVRPVPVTLAAGVAVALASGFAAAPAQARGERPENQSVSTFASVASTDSAVPPQPPEAASRNSLRLGDLPLPNRADVAISAAQFLPGVSLTAEGLRLRGGGTADVATIVDGFRLYQLRPPMPFVGQADVLAAGYGVTLADLSDGAVAMSSLRAPGVHARADLFHQGQEQAPSGYNADAPGFGPDISRHLQADVLTAAVSAPLWHDRLQLAAGVRRESAVADGAVDQEGILGTAPEWTSTDTTGALSLSFRPTPRHQIDVLALLDATDSANGDSFNVAPEAQPSRDGLGYMGGLRWTGRLTEVLTVSLQGSSEHRHTTLEPRFCRDQPDRCDSVSPTIVTFPRMLVYGNGLRRERGRHNHNEIAGSIGLRLGAGSWLQQRLHLVSRLASASADTDVATPGGQVVTNQAGAVPQARTSYYSNDPRLASAWATTGRSSWRHLTALEDDINLGPRLWIRPGIGLVSGKLVGAEEAVLIAETAPVFSLSAGWDVLGNGRTWLRGSANHRIDPTADGIAAQAVSTPPSQTCQWDPNTMSYSAGCVYAGGSSLQTVGLPCGPVGVDANGNPCVERARLPRTWEYTLGIRQALAGRVWIDLDGVYRRTSELSEVTETNRVWNGAGPALLGFRNGRPQTIANLATSEQLFRRYVGATVAMGGGVGGVNALLAYTYSQQDVRSALSYGALGPASYFESHDPNEQRHSIRALATYDIARVVSLGLVYTYDSGRRYDRLFRNDPTGAYEDYRATRGTNPGTNLNRATRGANPGTDINDPADDDVPSYPAIERLNLQARLRIGRWVPFGFDLYADLLNALDQRAGPGDLDARWIRLGAEFRY